MQKRAEKVRRELSYLQNTIYTEGKYGVLICLQCIDTFRKDSLIGEVFKDVKATRVMAHSFKTPTVLE
jgi:polyphosphate kinase 2 (PPK2 family)